MISNTMLKLCTFVSNSAESFVVWTTSTDEEVYEAVALLVSSTV